MMLKNVLFTFILSLSALIFSSVANPNLAFAALDLNKASVAELDGLKGVGPSTSSRILDERKKSEFKDWNDFISRVKGISAKKASKLSEQGLTVNNAAFTGVPVKDKKKNTKSNKTDKSEKSNNPEKEASTSN